jgi:hypothetical protein
MPVKLSSSSILKWPDAATVVAAVRRWAAAESARHPELVRLGYFGSYARGDWGVGSDLDLVAVVRGDPGPAERRTISWNLTALPVPTDLLVYSESEWCRVTEGNSRFASMLRSEVVWIALTAPGPTLDGPSSPAV